MLSFSEKKTTKKENHCIFFHHPLVQQTSVVTVNKKLLKNIFGNLNKVKIKYLMKNVYLKTKKLPCQLTETS